MLLRNVPNISITEGWNDCFESCQSPFSSTFSSDGNDIFGMVFHNVPNISNYRTAKGLFKSCQSTFSYDENNAKAKVPARSRNEMVFRSVK